MSICILGFVFSFRTAFGVLLAPNNVHVSTIPTLNRILALVLALVLVLSNAVLACFCLCPCRACLCLVWPLPLPNHPCPSGRLLLGVMMNLSVSCFVHLRDLYTHKYVLISSLKTPYDSQSRTVPPVRVSRDHLATKLQIELMRMSSARLCAFP